MTLLVRRVGETKLVKLNKAGLCRVGFADILGCYGTGPIKIVWLGEHKNVAR